MIEYINKIKNVGKYDDFNEISEFEQINLVFAENANGKTTLSEIFRSLGSDRSELVKRRKSHGSEDDIEVIINQELDNEAVFNSGEWVRTLSEDIYVYNSKFANENVISGFEVKTGHGERLYEFACGEEARKISEEISEKKSKKKEIKKEDIPKIGQQIKNKVENELGIKVGSQFEIVDFVDLEDDVKELRNDLEKEEKLLKQSIQAEKIKEASKLLNLNAIESDTDFKNLNNLLKSGIDKIQKEALTRVNARKDELDDDKSEEWLKWGHKHSDGEICPFCEQSLEGVNIVDHYSNYFSEEVMELYGEISSFKEEVKSEVEDLRKNNDNTMIEDKNSSLMQNIWSDYLDKNELPKLPDEGGIVDLLERILSNLKKKERDILNPRQSDISPKEVSRLISYYDYQVGEYNSSVKKLNEEIEQIKKNIPDKEKKEKRVQRLKLRIVRQENETVKNKCEDYQNKREEIDKINKDIEDLRNKRADVTKDILEDYSGNINDLLEKFGTEIKIGDGMKASNPGGRDKTTISYPLKLEDGKIDHRNDEDSILWLEDVLSDGDKRAFGLTFFLGKLEALGKPELNNSIIIIDDPVASFDYTRKQETIRRIRRLAKKAKQVIVMSHDKSFLKDMNSEIEKEIGNPDDIGYQKIVDGNIKPWKAKNDWQTKEVQEIKKLEEFVGERKGSYSSVKLAIRKVLEGELEKKFNELRGAKNLGDMIGRIRSGCVDGIDKDGDHYYFLNDKNNFSSPSAHSGDDDNNESELEREVEQTLEYVRSSKFD